MKLDWGHETADQQALLANPNPKRTLPYTCILSMQLQLVGNMLGQCVTSCMANCRTQPAPFNSDASRSQEGS